MKASFVLASLALTLTVAVSAQAQTETPVPVGTPTGDFATQKTRVLAHIDERMAAMTKMRDCVNSSASQADLKTCHHASRAEKHSKHAPT